MTRPVEDLLARAGIATGRGLSTFTAALTHASASDRPNYERLEYLGDAVLKLVVSEWLFAHEPPLSEGEMTLVRARCVSDAVLARCALAVDLGPHLILGTSEKRSGGREKASILASSFEALLGAVHLEHGHAAAAAFLARWLMPEYEAALPEGASKHATSMLQERVQRDHQCLPIYTVVARPGERDHAPVFEAEVMVGGRVIGRATGNSKREARQQAAAQALSALDGT